MIEYLELKNFRNHKHTKIHFQSKNTFIEGLNGSGKTSIIEAINYVSTLKSFKTTDDNALIQQNKPYFKIYLKTKKDEYEVVLNKGKKFLKINGSVYAKTSDFIANLKTIVFSSEDLELVYGSPSIKRNFLDTAMVQIKKEYLNNLLTYRKVLKERNALLKKLNIDSDFTFLKIINKRLEKEANIIIEARTVFVKNLNKAFKTRFKSFTQKDDVELIYKPNVLSNTLESVLNKRFKADLFGETTFSGPHRDELLIMFNNNLAKDYASQGQNRLISLSLKLALLDLYKNPDEIIILLDDVLSEFDKKTIEQIKVLFTIKNQIIITGTNNQYKEIEVLNINKREN